MPVSTSFRVRIVAGLSIAFVDGMSFDFLDRTNQLLCVYDYRGISWSLSTPVSASFRGPWNDFTTRVPIDVERFGGMARFFSIGALDQSLTGLEISPLRAFPINLAPFNTGFTAGASVGTGIGGLTKMFPALPAAQAPWPHSV